MVSTRKIQIHVIIVMKLSSFIDILTSHKFYTNEDIYINGSSINVCIKM